MSEINKKKRSYGLNILILFMALIEFALIITHLVKGKNIALFNPTGLIAQQQHSLMMFTIELVLVFAIPTVGFLFYTAWKYRESNTSVKYEPTTHYGKPVVLAMWATPAAFILVLASVMWPATYKLAPQKAIQTSTGAKTMTIEVISMRWKWLFIYPDQKIATVNFVQMPVGTPVEFDMTADETPMSSFWIPNLGGQLYSMTSHSNRLNLVADKPGDYPGSTPEINGAGFAGMRFIARASSTADFDNWVAGVKQSGKVLDDQAYSNLLIPSQNNPAAGYSSYQQDFYATVLTKYAELNGGHTHH